MTNILSYAPSAPLYHGVVFGDSQTDALGGYAWAHRTYPYRLEEFLALRGCRIKLGNYGKGGDTSADVLARVHSGFRYGVPVLAGLHVGVNDAHLAETTRTTAGTGSVKEVQTIAFGGNTPSSIIGGNFSYGWGGDAGTIAWNATTAQVQTILNAGAAITAAGGVTVTGSAGAWVVTFNTNGSRALITTNTTAMTTLFVQATLMAFKHAAFGAWDSYSSGRGRQAVGPAAVSEPANLPAQGKIGQRQVVLKDTAASSGIAPAVWMTTAGICVANTGIEGENRITVWECRNSRAGIYGWGRVAVPGQAPLAGGCSMIFCTDGSNYLNFTTGGDTPSSNAGGYAAVRIAVRSAIAAEQVSVGGTPVLVRINLYGYQRRRITGSAGGYAGAVATDPNFSSDTAIVPTVAYEQAQSWHLHLGGSDNQHHNNYGHGIVAEAIIDGGPGSASGSTAPDDTAAPAPAGLPAAWYTALGGS